MRSIDIHAHSTPQSFIRTVKSGQEWHGLNLGSALSNPRAVWTPEQRIADMDSLGVDVQVVSTTVAFYSYDREPDVAAAVARDCNDEVSQMTKDHPDRFAGLATVPMQDVKAAITELERSVVQLGLKGAMINDHVNGRTYDDPEFLPFFKAAEQMGAMLLIHQKGGDTTVTPRTNSYHLFNTIGNLVDRAVTFATMVHGGVMDACPDLRVCLSHGGGYTCFGIGRMDRGWEVRSEARTMPKPPSAYLRSFYYDCLTHSEPALRMLIDTVGVDRVVFGTDWPADMAIDWSASWVLSLESLTQDEKDAILWKNLEKLLGI